MAAAHGVDRQRRFGDRGALAAAPRGAILASRSGAGLTPARRTPTIRGHFAGPPQGTRPMSRPAGTLITVATYNELENLPRLLDEVFHYAPNVHVLVIDDNSP